MFRIINREEFDKWLVNSGEFFGIAIHQGQTALDATQKKDFIEVITNENVFHAKILVCADGANSPIRRMLSWEGFQETGNLLNIISPYEKKNTKQFDQEIAVFDFSVMKNG